MFLAQVSLPAFTKFACSEDMQYSLYYRQTIDIVNISDKGQLSTTVICILLKLTDNFSINFIL